MFRNVVLDGHYRGQATRVGMDVGLAYQGDIQIELIVATDTAASPYRAEDGTRLLGLHHTARIVEDFDTAVAEATARGMTLVFAASNPATRVAYLAMPGSPGALFELICGPGMRAMKEAGIAAVQSWNGDSLVTEIDFALLS